MGIINIAVLICIRKFPLHLSRNAFWKKVYLTMGYNDYFTSLNSTTSIEITIFKFNGGMQNLFIAPFHIHIIFLRIKTKQINTIQPILNIMQTILS